MRKEDLDSLFKGKKGGGVLSGLIKWDPFSGGCKHCKCMLMFMGLISLILVHCLGWKYIDPCFFNGLLHHQVSVVLYNYTNPTCRKVFAEARSEILYCF